MKRYMVLILWIVAFEIFGSAVENLQFGKEMFRRKLYEEAIQELTVILEEYPTSKEAEEALYLIGESYNRLYRYAEAETYYRRLKDGYPNSKYKDESLQLLAQMLFLQKQYNEAALHYKNLIQLYPQTEFTKKSLYEFIQTYLYSKQYQLVVQEGNKVIKNYPENKSNPAIMLLISRAYFAMNMKNDGTNTLELIKTKFANHEERWKAEQILIEEIAKEQGNVAAIKAYESLLKQNIPRALEADFRLVLATLYQNEKQYNKASEEFQKIIDKFSNHPNMDRIILQYLFSLDQASQYATISKTIENYEKYFLNSKAKTSYELYKAKAFIIQAHFQDAEDLLNTIPTQTDSLRFEKTYLQAFLFEQKGNLTTAIQHYSEILSKFSVFGRNEEILLRLGDIYANKLQKYATAIQYFQQLLTISQSSKMTVEAQQKIASCYEKLGLFDDALNQLYQIDLDSISNDELRNKIVRKQAYLREFFKKDYEQAFEKLVTLLFQNNKSTMQKKLLDILIYDIKNYDEALSLIKNNPNELYKKGYILLKIAQKNKLEGNHATFENTLQKANAIVGSLEIQKKMKDATDLSIRAAIIKGDSLSTAVQQKMIAFINQYSADQSAHFFRMLLSSQKNIPSTLLTTLLTDLKEVNEVPQQEYLLAKLRLAELLYKNEKYPQALLNYQIVKKLINLSRPSIMLHYAESYIKTGNIREGYSKLEFLVKNTESFAEFADAVGLLAAYYQKQNNLELALQYYEKYPEKARDDEYYIELANLYKQKNDLENEKNSIMHIREKTVEVLARLANLHYITESFEMASYTYEDLKKKDQKNRSFYQYRLAHIAFLKKQYEAAAKHYSSLLKKNVSHAEIPLSEAVKEAVISYLRIKNRPKADALAKQYKKTLKTNNTAELEIELNRGIYYKDIDLKRAEKYFNKVLKEKNIPESLAAETYYWRGVTRLENKALEESRKDFETVLKKKNHYFINDANLKLGTIYFSQEEFQKALQHYAYVIENDDTGELAYDAAGNYAIVCKTMHEWDKAIRAYELILERWGDRELQGETLFDIAFCYYRDKKYPKAVPMFEKAIVMIEDRALQSEAQYWIGESYFGMEAYDDAVRSFLKAGYQYPDQPIWAGISELKAGESYLKMNETEKAKQTFRRIIKTYGPGSEPGSQASKLLKTL